MTIEACPLNTIDHAVLAVGWDRDDIYEYLIIKNSYGDDWGHEGYIKL